MVSWHIDRGAYLAYIVYGGGKMTLFWLGVGAIVSMILAVLFYFLWERAEHVGWAKHRHGVMVVFFLASFFAFIIVIVGILAFGG